MKLMNFNMERVKRALLKEGWAKGILFPIALGTVVFLLLAVFISSAQAALFWGVVVSYMTFGAFFSLYKSRTGKFERVNRNIGEIIVVIAVINLMFLDFNSILGWPLLIFGIILATTAIFGCFKFEDQNRDWSAKKKHYYDNFSSGDN